MNKRVSKIRFGPEYLAVCRSYSLNPWAARNLTSLNSTRQVIGTALASPAIETNLRNLGLIKTNDNWSGCIDITERGSAMCALLVIAAELDRTVADDEPVSALWEEFINAQNTVCEADETVEES